MSGRCPHCAGYVRCDDDAETLICKHCGTRVSPDEIKPL